MHVPELTADHTLDFTTIFWIANCDSIPNISSRLSRSTLQEIIAVWCVIIIVEWAKRASIFREQGREINPSLFFPLFLSHRTVPSRRVVSRAQVLNNPWEEGTKEGNRMEGRQERGPRDVITVPRVGTNIRLQAVAAAPATSSHCHPKQREDRRISANYVAGGL